MTYLSYSGYKSYATCPYQYWHKYVNKTTLLVPENGINTLYGSTVGIVFEAFYRDKLWKAPDCTQKLIDLAKPTLDQAIQDQTRQGRLLDWGDEKANYKNPKEILADVVASIPDGVETIRQQKLVGPFMEAEMKLDFRFGRHIMGGRADFVVRRTKPHGDLLIIDGKGSKHREKYLDGKPKKKNEPVEGVQLKWYSVLYRELYGVVPDGLAYLFWRFKGDRAVEWVPFSVADLNDLKTEVLSTISRIEATSKTVAGAGHPRAREELRQELFPAQAGGHCNLCAYNTVCEEGKKVVLRTKRAKSAIPTGVEELALSADDR
jgi:hypothetical protein